MAPGSVPLVPGAPGSAKYGANNAEKCLLAGNDILLFPHDMTGEDAARYYDEYIGRIAEKVESNAQLRARIDQSVRRVLNLKETYGILDGGAPAYISNLAAGTSSGSPESKTAVTIDYYYDAADGLAPRYTDDLKAAIAKTDTVVALAKCSGITSLQPANPQYRGIAQTLADTHPAGTLPVNIPSIVEEDGHVSYDLDNVLYLRGTGPHYAYAFTAGEGGSYDAGSGQDLAFATNARYDCLTSVLSMACSLRTGSTRWVRHTALSLAAA